MDHPGFLAELAQLAQDHAGAELGHQLRTAIHAQLQALDDTELGALATTVTALIDGGQRGREGDEEDPPHLYFASLQEFVEEWLLPTYRRSTRGHSRTWCPRWWAHAEALSRLEALWRAWEALRWDPATGISVWWRDHADHHLTVLLDPDGPFKGCEDGHASRQREQLPSDPPPPGLFDPDQQPEHAERATTTTVRSAAPIPAAGGLRATPRQANGRAP